MLRSLLGLSLNEKPPNCSIFVLVAIFIRSCYNQFLESLRLLIIARGKLAEPTAGHKTRPLLAEGLL